MEPTIASSSRPTHRPGRRLRGCAAALLQDNDRRALRLITSTPELLIALGGDGRTVYRIAVRTRRRNPNRRACAARSASELDAHGLYSQQGFAPAKHPERYMEKLAPAVYRRPAG